jgi:hypothetical protein
MLVFFQYCQRHLLSTTDAKLRNAVTFTYVPEIGSVTSISCSMYQRNTFISSNIGGQVTLYNILDASPIKRFEIGNEPVGACMWYNKNTFLCVSEDGKTYFYDVEVHMYGLWGIDF